MWHHCYFFLVTEQCIYHKLCKLVPEVLWQRGWYQTKVLMSKTIAVYVRHKSLYIKLRSPAKQQRELTKFCVVYWTWTTTAIFLVFPFGIERCCCTFGLSTVFEPLAYRTDLNSCFTSRRPRRGRCRCLCSLLSQFNARGEAHLPVRLFRRCLSTALFIYLFTEFIFFLLLDISLLLPILEFLLFYHKK